MYKHVLVSFVGGPKDGLDLDTNKRDEINKAQEYFNKTAQGTVSATLSFPCGQGKPHIVDEWDYNSHPNTAIYDVYTVSSSADDSDGGYRRVVLSYTGRVTQ